MNLARRQTYSAFIGEKYSVLHAKTAFYFWEKLCSSVIYKVHLSIIEFGLRHVSSACITMQKFEALYFETVFKWS
jgi:hypothetical protein